MGSINALQKQIIIARNELKNLRQEISKLKKIYEKDVEKIKDALSWNTELNLCGSNKTYSKVPAVSHVFLESSSQSIFNMKPIGYIESCFKTKNGTPRQASLCPESKAFLKLNNHILSKPYRALDGLNEFSHIWIIFVFHDNNSNSIPKTKVHPPKLNGTSIGVFASRSPHRPNPIGLSLVQLVKIEGNTLVLSGVDLIDKTPVLDIKPYIPSYDSPLNEIVKGSSDSRAKSAMFKMKSCLSEIDLHQNSSTSEDVSIAKEAGSSGDNFDAQQRENDILEIAEEVPIVRTAAWITEQQNNLLEVFFTTRAEHELNKFHSKCEKKCKFCLNFMTDWTEVKISIINVLKNDPRSVYRRTKCQDKLYYFTVDSIHITCWFDDCYPSVEVLRVQPLEDAKFLNKLNQENDDL